MNRFREMVEQIRYFRDQVLQINENSFDGIALELFRFQARFNPVYAGYLSNLGVSPESVREVTRIPFLPIRFFRNLQVTTGEWRPAAAFHSSRTTGMVTSTHLVDDLSFYHDHARRIFEHQVGPLSGANLIAVLPSYVERNDSSLVSMVDQFVRWTGSALSGFFKPDPAIVSIRIREALATGRPTILFGVTFALLDLVSAGIDLSGVTVIETGGMKGRRKEIVREDLHNILRSARPDRICSEYGMTELLSQAYAVDGRNFTAPPSMRVMFREVNDPFSVPSPTGQGILMVADLANVHSCCFIET
ncbi:MAG: acyl transferase, partial [Bacteroidota bacterium]